MSTFVKIPDDWCVQHLDFESRFILAVIHQFSNNKRNYHMKIDTFCQKYGIKSSTYKRRIGFLKEHDILSEVGRLPNNIQILSINEDELEWFIENPPVDKSKQNDKVKSTSHLGQNDPTLRSNRPSTKVKSTSHLGQNDPTHITDKLLDKKTNKNNIQYTTSSDDKHPPRVNHSFSSSSLTKGKTNEELISNLDLTDIDL